MFYIYKLLCTTNGKGYVGFTKEIKRRMRQHKDTAKSGKGSAIHAAIRKYGWQTFQVEELYRSENKEQTLEMEDTFINLHETKGIKGYNLTRGGGKQGPSKGYRWKGSHTQEAKNKMANGHAHNWVITFPDGHTEVIRNLRAFCLSNKISKGHMIDTTTGRRNHCKGFKCSKTSNT